MNSNDREFQESPFGQGEDERCAYRFSTLPWGGSPTSVSMKLYSMNKETKTDVSATNLFGSTTVDGNYVTTPLIISLVANTKYRLEVQWVKDGNTVEAFAIIYGQV
jgi:hypothetical protein